MFERKRIPRGADGKRAFMKNFHCFRCLSPPIRYIYRAHASPESDLPTLIIYIRLFLFFIKLELVLRNSSRARQFIVEEQI